MIISFSRFQRNLYVNNLHLQPLSVAVAFWGLLLLLLVRNGRKLHGRLGLFELSLGLEIGDTPLDLLHLLQIRGLRAVVALGAMVLCDLRMVMPGIAPSGRLEGGRRTPPWPPAPGWSSSCRGTPRQWERGRSHTCPSSSCCTPPSPPVSRTFSANRQRRPRARRPAT